ncbi:TetR/AcrR family transcriptional regulator [Rhodoplanes sp. TEM]|uniref:TetR/AcrR family transcriptional regulator n=1 Tax=Rhodoplanes tepidamans TaxID=200616 RepID=A0ABT5J8N4_RHOTP|nr:TetR/AcrR family transcriptional regulator [Rhodoplanes sp. TEM]MDC7785936.1 TetR/AcrR family transcriptional regulator [Rhodoplanes tepidamans]MDC7986252.1 TetR/AcrR family transcriptional regulator [Rhodoplanes sp. TEM]MDQ0355445.1 AcrR family transcriptional regulator [Rhodoplanes tepidamans]
MSATAGPVVPVPAGTRATRSEVTPDPRDARAEKAAQRREAILKAALDEFSDRGFAAARLDDVAKRAGVAKGTIYLYFEDKEALFQELITTMMGPLIADLKALSTQGLPPRAALERLLAVFAREVLGTERRRVLRLVLSDGPRFPRVAEFHYRQVVEPALGAIRSLLARAAARGEVHPRLAEFPQLVIAPGLMAVVWASLFDRFAPLDPETLLRAHLDVLFGSGAERSGAERPGATP